MSRPEEALLSISPHHPLQEACLWYVLHPLASVRGEAAGDQSREHAALALVAELPGYGDKVVNRALCALCDGEIAVQRPDAASAAAGAPADAPEPVPTAAQAALARADLVAEFRAARALAFALRRHAVAEEEQRSLQAAMAVERDACPPPRRRMTAGEEAEEAAAARARAVSRARVQLTHVAACDGDAASLLWRCVGADGLPAAPTHGGTSSRHAADDTGADAAISTLRRRRRASLQRHFGRSLSAAARAVQASMRLVQRAGAAGSRPSGAECDCLAAALSGATDDAVYQVHMREQLTATPRRLATAGAWARRFARWPTDDARTGSGRVAWVHAARFAALSAAAASGRDPVLASALTAPVVAAGIAERLQRLARREGGGTGEVQGTGAEMAVLVESCAAAVATPGTDGGAALWGAFVAHGLVAELAARVEQRPWCPVGTAFALCASLCVQRAPGRVGPEHARVVGCAVATSLALCARGDEEEEEEPVVARARLLRTWALTQIIHAHPAAATDVARPLRRAEVWTAVARRLGTASAPLRSQAFAELSLASEMASAGLGPPPEARVAEAQSSAAAREEQAPGPAAAQGSGWAGLLPAAAATALTSLTRPSSSPSAAALPVVCRVEVGPGLSLSCRPRRDAARLVASVSSQLECPGLHEVAALMSCLGALNEWDRSAVAHARPAQGGGEEGCGAVGREGGHEADKGGEEEEEEERKEEEDEGQDTFQRSMQQLLDPTLLTTGPERLDMGSERTPRPLSHGSGAPSGLEAVPEGGEGGEEEGVWTASVSPPLPAGGAEEHEVMDPLFSYRLVSLPVSGFCEALRGVRCQLRFAAGRAALLGQLPQPASALEAYGGVRAGTTVGGLALPLALRTCLHAVAAAAAHLRRGRPLPASLQSPRPGTAGSDGLDPGMDAWAILAEGCGTVGEALRRSLWLRVRLGSSPAVTGLMRELLAVACGEGAHGAGERSGVARRAAQVEAARCVGAFARACRGNQDTLVAASVVGLLGGLLHSEAARVRAAACDAVADVAEGNRAAAADVRAAGGLARLVETVDTGGACPRPHAAPALPPWPHLTGTHTHTHTPVAAAAQTSAPMGRPPGPVPPRRACCGGTLRHGRSSPDAVGWESSPPRRALFR